MKVVLAPLSKKRNAADLLVCGVFEKENIPASLASLEPVFSQDLKSALQSGRFEAKAGQVLSSYSSQYREAREIVAVGLGTKKDYKKSTLRRAAGLAVAQAKGRSARHLRILADAFIHGEIRADDALGQFAESALLGTYKFDRYMAKKKDSSKDLGVVEILLGGGGPKSKDRERVDRTLAIAEGVILARDLINEPANVLTPARLAKAAQEMAGRKGVKCRILEEAELKRLNMNGILAVNRGSRTPANLITLEHGARYKSKGTICLVGKGVTFDTGGISIKPAKDMEKMKYDMSGAAAVIAALGVAADLKLPVHVIGLAPAVENMVAVDPQRPGDIIRMYNGKSVEVINTDAEGRLILADALAYSEKYKPKAIIDLATLTGMCAYTFGDQAIGLMGNNEKWSARVKAAGEATGERCWELPMWDEYAEQVKGTHSDLQNVGGPYAGTITAAMFLKEFVPSGTPWVHLDIAGVAWCNSSRLDCPKGGTGAGVRLLTELLASVR